MEGGRERRREETEERGRQGEKETASRMVSPPADSLLKHPQSQDPARTKSGAPNPPGLREVGRDLTAQTITRCLPATSRGIHISLLLTPCVPSSSLSLIFSFTGHSFICFTESQV